MTASPPTVADAPPTTVSKSPQTARIPCRFFASKNGCRLGDACPYLHEISSSQLSGAAPSLLHTHKPSGQNVKTSPDQALAKPVTASQKTHPRTFQLQQLRRRFSPEETEADGNTVFVFRMKPTDPDFPFELSALHCVLTVPNAYPQNALPSLRVTNPELGRGFQINVERGFDAIVQATPRQTLLTHMNTLDRQLESLLSGTQADTIKIVTNRTPNWATKDASDSASMNQPATNSNAVTESNAASAQAIRVAAAARRETETRQLEARMGRQPGFAKSGDGIAFTLPLAPTRHEELPESLKALKACRLFVPRLYPLQSCRIALLDVASEASRPIERAFQQKVKESPEFSLMVLTNYLATNLHQMARFVQPEDDADPEYAQGFSEMSIHDPDEATRQVADDKTAMSSDDRPHLHFIARPPEWDLAAEGDDSSELESSSEGSDEETDEAHEAQQAQAPAEAAERGVAISFPGLELYGIEILEMQTIGLAIRCERCKDTMDVPKVAAGQSRQESCKKCASTMTVEYRRDLMHADSVRAGYLDLNGCAVTDLLPSFFIPTCSGCSTPMPAPGCVAVRGDSISQVCRECHGKMNFKVPDVRFLIVAANARQPGGPRRHRPRENLGIVAGQPLPRCGRCSHYAKSYRWFRFGCCAKVYPCDRCHDEAEEHPNEHAARMICGYCSREQRYHPENCAICRAVLIGKKGQGFWEGGKGTRDPLRMNRKDPRKYRRRRAPPPQSGSTAKRKT